MKKALWLLSLLVITVSLTACGGSSGSSTPDTPVNPTITGAVAAAPVKDAKVMVDFKYLTAKAQKASEKKVAIVVGTSDKNGKVKFVAAELKKLDRKQAILMYSDGGVKFSSEYATRKEVKAAAASEAANYFYGSMRAVLEKEQKEAYLTMANTLVAKLVEDEMPVADAKEMVLNLIENRLGVIAMADPFGNPLKSLEKSEYVSQSIMSILDDVTEESMAAGTAKFGDVEEQILDATTAVNYDNMIANVKAALDTDAYDPDMGELTKSKVMAAEAMTYELDVENASTADKTYVQFSDEEEDLNFLVKIADINNSDVAMRFSAVAITNSTVDTNSGGYIVESIAGQGKLKQGSLDVVAGTYFDSTNTFTIEPPKDTDGNVIEDEFSSMSVTLVATDADKTPVENMQPVTITFTAVDESAIIVKEDGLTAETSVGYTIELGTNIVPEDGDTEAKIKGDSITDAPVTFTTEVKFINENKDEERDNTFIRVTAPANYAFVNVEEFEGSEFTRAIGDDEKVTVVELKAKLGSDITTKFKANIIRTAETATFFDKKDLEIEVFANSKEIAEEEYAVGFAAVDAYFAVVRDYKLTTAGAKAFAATGVAKEFSEKMSATYTTWEYKVDADNYDLDVDDVTETFETFYVLKDDDDADYMYKAKADGVEITPVISFTDDGVITAKYDLGDMNGAADDGDPLSITFAVDGTYFVRVAPKEVEAYDATLDKDLPDHGGVEVEADTADTVDAVAGATVAAFTSAQSTTATSTGVASVTITMDKSDLNAMKLKSVDSWVTATAGTVTDITDAANVIESVSLEEIETGYTVTFTLKTLTYGDSAAAAAGKITVTIDTKPVVDLATVAVG